MCTQEFFTPQTGQILMSHRAGWDTRQSLLFENNSIVMFIILQSDHLFVFLLFICFPALYFGHYFRKRKVLFLQRWKKRFSMIGPTTVMPRATMSYSCMKCFVVLGLVVFNLHLKRDVPSTEMTQMTQLGCNMYNP